MFCDECKIQCSGEDELLAHIKQHSLDSQKKNDGFVCSKCDFSATTVMELSLHKKSHSGESPLKFINTSFSEIIHSSPSTKGVGRLSFSQPTTFSINVTKNSVNKIPKRSRSSALSPENLQAHKKQATKFSVSSIPKCK